MENYYPEYFHRVHCFSIKRPLEGGENPRHTLCMSWRMTAIGSKTDEKWNDLSGMFYSSSKCSNGNGPGGKKKIKLKFSLCLQLKSIRGSTVKIRQGSGCKQPSGRKIKVGDVRRDHCGGSVQRNVHLANQPRDQVRLRIDLVDSIVLLPSCTRTRSLIVPLTIL